MASLHRPSVNKVSRSASKVQVWRRRLGLPRPVTAQSSGAPPSTRTKALSPTHHEKAGLPPQTPSLPVPHSFLLPQLRSLPTEILAAAAGREGGGGHRVEMATAGGAGHSNAGGVSSPLLSLD